MPDLVGKTIGQYQILEQVGQGGMATVYRGHQPSMNRYVAVKVLSPSLAEDETFVKRFRQEAQAIAQLEHPHILPIYDYGEQDGLIYMVTRYIDSGTLKDRLTRHYSPQEAQRIIGPIAEALDYAHSQGIVHRDVKPSNILIDPRGQPLLTDFGIAKMMEATANLTGSGVIGTPTYISPEQAQGQTIDGRSDIYALGVVLYEMLIGTPPYEAETPVAVVMKHITDPPPAPRLKRPDLPAEIEKIVLKALAKNPDHRYQRAGELSAALNHFLSSQKTAVSVEPPSPPAAAPPPARQRPAWTMWAMGGGAALCLAAFLCAGLFFVLRSRTEPDATPTSALVRSTAEAESLTPPAETPAAVETPAELGGEEPPVPEQVANTLPFQSAVQIWALQREGDGWTELWNGSGSIVTRDGYILTNAHVVLPDKYYDVDGLLVSLTEKADEPPVPTYMAEVVVADPDLDLAVIRVTSDLDGNPVDYDGLDLPTVPLGDSDELELGTAIRILGFPGIGGETITLTSGEVAGFVSEPGIKGRAFIKTSATIAGGNSGGMAIDEGGVLIGVPTQLGYGGDDQFVDCRVLADTNGDGVIDDRDGCIPTGGFINALRPINLAKPFIESAIAGLAQQPPAPEPERTEPEAPPNAGEELYFDDFAASGPDWSLFTDDEVSSRIEDGRMVIDVDVENTVAWATLEQEYDNVDIEVETAKLAGPEDNGFGVLLRYQDGDNFYLFEISSDGFYRASLLEDDEWATLIEWTRSDVINLDGPNVMAVESQGPRFTLFINGVQVDQVSDDTFDRGRIGLAARAISEPHVSIGFDNLSLRVPGGPRRAGIVPERESGTVEDLIYSDDFSVERDDWFIGDDEDAAFGYDGGEYFIEVYSDQLETWSSLSLDSDDLIVEVDARKVSGTDLNSFGVLCRYVDADNFYALEVGSDGSYAIRRVHDGEFEALVDWSESDAIEQGEVWNRVRASCIGDELSLWVNDVLLASTTDDTLPSGDMALTVGTYDEGDVRVHFDNLAVYSAAPAVAEETEETLLIDDFSDEDGGWPVGEESASRFYYDDGEYYIEIFKSNFTAWASSGDSWDDVVIDVDARQVSGPDDNQYGLFCRYQDNDNFYEFDISGDGFYAIYLQKDGEYQSLKKWTATSAIRQGEATNHLTAICDGDRLALWVNGEFVAEVFDDSLSEGEIALAIGSFDEPDVVIAFDNLRVSAP